MKLFKHIFFFLLLLTVSHSVYSQTNPSAKYRSAIIGTQFLDTIAGKYQPNIYGVVGLPAPSIEKINGQQKYVFTFDNPTDSVGEFKIVYQYVEAPNKVRYTTTHLRYQTSIARAKTDYITVEEGETVIIKPLINDLTTATSLSLAGVSQVQFGEATFASDSITYVAPLDKANDAIVYSIVDDLGGKAIGRVVINIEQSDFEAVDTLEYTLLNTRQQQVLLSASGFGMTLSPTKGVVTQLSPNVYNYKPNAAATGLDVFQFTDSDGNSRLIKVNLVSLAENKSSVVHDVFYTARNQAITFDVLANDLSKNFPISTYSAGLVRDTLGVFTYTPPADFVGEKNFTYTVNYGGGNTYQGKIKVVIGNIEPDPRFDYHFDTRKNESTVITYNIPMSSYAFELLTEPLYGVAEIFYQPTTLDIGCDSVKAQAIIEYTPDLGYYGEDEFDISYCISDSCYTYKIKMSIHDTQDTACRCLGPDCVYEGDLNGDGRVSVSDILALGRYMGSSGQSRATNTLPSWAGQAGADWTAAQANGRDVKHIDADGDGSLTKSDMNAVDNNYGAFNTLVPREILSVKDFPFYLVPNATELDSGDVLILDVMYGTASKPALDVFGVAFELNLPAVLIDSASVTGYFEESGWFANHGATLQLIKQPQDGRIQAGFTKAGAVIDDEIEGFYPMGSSGSGKIGQISMVIDDEIEGFKSSAEFITMPIILDQIETEDIDGHRYAIEGSTIELKYRRKKITEPTPTEEKLMIYPNPARDYVNIHFNGRNTIKGYKMTDLMGHVVTQNTSYDEQSSSISTSNLPSGTYIIQVTSTAGVITKKIEIIND
jgi:hypothetical protein